MIDKCRPRVVNVIFEQGTKKFPLYRKRCTVSTVFNSDGKKKALINRTQSSPSFEWKQSREETQQHVINDRDRFSVTVPRPDSPVKKIAGCSVDDHGVSYHAQEESHYAPIPHIRSGEEFK